MLITLGLASAHEQVPKFVFRGRGGGEGGVSISNFFCNDQEVSSIFNVKLYDLVVLLENVGKQTESQTDRQTDRQFWESNLTVAGKGNEYQKSTNDINRLYETISTLQPLTHPSSSTGV